MIRRSLNIADFSLRLGLLFLPLFALSIAAYIRFGSGLIYVASYDIDIESYFGLLFFTTAVWAVAIEHYGLHRIDLIFQKWRAAKMGVLACFLTYSTMMAATFFYRSGSFSRLFVALGVVTMLLLLFLIQHGFRLILSRAHWQGHRYIRVLIIGADRFADRIARIFLEGNVIPCAVVGFVRLPGQEIEVTASSVVELADLKMWSVNQGIDDVIVAIPPARFGEIGDITARLEPLCLPIRVVLDFGEGVFVREQIFDFGGVPMFDLRATPAESVRYLVMKRGFDLLFSVLVLLLTAPLLLLIALALRLTSPGPALFFQERVGLNGQVFRMYKFRTMRIGDPGESDTRWTTENDPRRTRIGTFLRRSNLDELPQFFNVLKGNMSVVGPRPERPFFVQKFMKDIEKYQSRHYLKVGITGWAQVNGLRGDTSVTERVEHDIYYLRHWSLAFDLRIIFLTVIRAFSARNAY